MEFLSEALKNYGPIGFMIVVFMLVVFLGGGKLWSRVINFFIAAIEKRDQALDKMAKDFSCSLKEQNECHARSQREQAEATRAQTDHFLRALEIHSRSFAEKHDMLLDGIKAIKKKIGVH